MQQGRRIQRPWVLIKGLFDLRYARERSSVLGNGVKDDATARLARGINSGHRA